MLVSGRTRSHMNDRNSPDASSGLCDAVEAGGDTVSIATRLRELEDRHTAIAGELAALQPVPHLPAAVVESRLNEWRRLLRQSPTQARAVLQRVLAGPLVFTPCDIGYMFEAPTRFDRLFEGFAIRVPDVGNVPDFMKADVGMGLDHYQAALDADYSKLLERAYGQWVASPKGLAPFFEDDGGKGMASPKGTAPFCVNGSVIRRAA
jgi:hypothetical protein